MKNIYEFSLNKEQDILRNNWGFTLLEMLIALAIFSILTSSLYYMMATYSKTFTSQDVRVVIQQTMRSCIDLMIRDIRSAGFDPTGKYDVGILTAESTKIEFSMNKNDDEDLDTNDFVTITYSLDTTQPSKPKITMQEVTSSGTNKDDLIDNVTALQFSYFDENGTDLGTSPVPSDIRSVGILLTVQEPAGRAGVISDTMTTRVLCRNLAYR